MQLRKSYEYPDITLLIMVALLTGYGIVMVYSSSAMLAEKFYEMNSVFLIKQTIGLVIGIVLMWYIAFKLDIYDLRRNSIELLLINIFLLILVFVPHIGKEINGSKRWINLYFFTIQPSEFVKISLVVYLSDVISRKQKNINDFKQVLLPMLIIIATVLILIRFEPDFGRMILITSVVFVLLLVGGLSIKYVVSSVVPSLLVIFYWLRHDPVRWARIMEFFNKTKDLQGKGYQLDQSLQALQSGGLFGVGLGNSRQKFFYLPEAHNDFIFAIIGEELGFIGAIILLILFSILVYRGLKLAYKTFDSFQGLLVIGIISMIGFEAFINMGVVVGALPTKGMPLPFISYGVSSLIANLIAIGILLNVSRNNS